MTTLEDLCERLGRQFLDPHALAVPQQTREEALRLALEEINLSLGQTFRLTGLDGETNGNLPEGYLPALLSGAAAMAVAALAHSDLSSRTNMPTDRDQLLFWAQHLKRQFDLQLDRLRLQSLQTAQNLTHVRWEWQESRNW